MDDNDKHPLLMMIMMMLKKMLIMPVAMNDQRQQQRRSQTNLSAGLCLQQSAFYYALNGTFVALPLTQLELQPNFHMYIYIYVQYTYYQWVKHGLIF